MKWRLIPYAENSAAMNMAIDESVWEHIKAGKSPPTIRLYGWKPSAVTIGTFQCREDEVDMDEAEKQGIHVVRRLTGGGAVYHDNYGEVTYSIIAPEDNFPKDILTSYEEVCGLVVNSLKSLDIEASFRAINDVIVDQKKISGNAQTRRGGIFLQHGTVLYDVDVDKMFSLLKVDEVKVSDKFVQSVKKVVTSVLQQKKIEKQELIEAMVAAFTSGKDFEKGKLSESEVRRAGELSAKYSSEEWNDSRN